MNTMLLKAYIKLQSLMNHEEGQDLVEYGLLVALIALAVVAAAGKVGTAISIAFSNIASTIS